MAQYWTCPYCGDHLDLGEKCYCFLEKERRQQETQKSLATGQDGQIYMRGMTDAGNVRRAI